MIKKLYNYFYFFLFFLLFTSCQKREFVVVSNENTLLKKDDISKLIIADKIVDYYRNTVFVDYDSYANYLESKRRIDEIFNSNLKGIQSKISIKNNSEQIIENSTITVVIKLTFDNDKEFNYIRPYRLVADNEIWKKDETVDINLTDVINFSITDEINILKIHTPKNVAIEYYITAKNSIGYNNIGNTKETLNLDYPNEFYSGSEKAFGVFTSKKINEEEILGLGEKIFEEDITDLWNEKIKNESVSQNNDKPKNGDLDNTFLNQENKKKELDEKLIKEKLISEGWKEEEIQNGQLPSCYNFKSTKGKIKNRLEVVVGGGTDVSIKMMNKETEKCIRYVFINSGTTYSIENIPEGKYYLKIAYGKDWFSKVENGQCIGKFIKNPLYEKGEDILDFNIQRKINGSSIPSYQLSLDVVSNGISNSFSSQNISESDFNK